MKAPTGIARASANDEGTLAAGAALTTLSGFDFASQLTTYAPTSWSRGEIRHLQTEPDTWQQVSASNDGTIYALNNLKDPLVQVQEQNETITLSVHKNIVGCDPVVKSFLDGTGNTIIEHCSRAKGTGRLIGKFNAKVCAGIADRLSCLKDYVMRGVAKLRNSVREPAPFGEPQSGFFGAANLESLYDVSSSASSVKVETQSDVLHCRSLGETANHLKDASVVCGYRDYNYNELEGFTKDANGTAEFWPTHYGVESALRTRITVRHPQCFVLEDCRQHFVQKLKRLVNLAIAKQQLNGLADAVPNAAKRLKKCAEKKSLRFLTNCFNKIKHLVPLFGP